MGTLGTGKLVNRCAAATSANLPVYRCKLLGNRSIAQLWDWLAAGHGRLKPRLFGNLHLAQRLVARAAKG